MFDHLDDPEAYVPGPELRTAAVRRGRSLKRRRRLVGGGVATVVLLLAGVAASAAVVDHKLDSVERIDVAGLRETAKAVDPQVVLFVGADSAEGLEPDPNRVRPGRTDTIILARVDAGNEVVSVLPLNRDLWVDIPGHGPNRINQAYSLGGPELLIDTIRQVYGIEVDHYVETDFGGVIAIGDALGGLSFSFPKEVQDQGGLHVAAGCHRYDGRELLALSRARHLKYRDGETGYWLSLDNTSDVGRLERAQVIGGALIARLTEIDATDPAELIRLLDAFVNNVKLDQNTTANDLLGLFRAVSGSTVVPVRLPVVDAIHDGANVLEVDPAAQSERVAQFLGTSEPGPSTADPLGDGRDPATSIVLPDPC